MAEGLLHAAAGDLVEVRSAGSKPAGLVQPRAIQVLEEIGIDISSHRSKHVSEFYEQPIATVITVCGEADDACPMFPGKATRYHWGFSDPAHTKGTDEEILREFRRVRDEMKRVFDAYAAGLRDTRSLAT
jgi:arsenate reductase